MRIMVLGFMVRTSFSDARQRGRTRRGSGPIRPLDTAPAAGGRVKYSFRPDRAGNSDFVGCAGPGGRAAFPASVLPPSPTLPCRLIVFGPGHAAGIAAREGLGAVQIDQVADETQAERDAVGQQVHRRLP